jgi:hypothetical protein
MRDQPAREHRPEREADAERGAEQAERARAGRAVELLRERGRAARERRGRREPLRGAQQSIASIDGANASATDISVKPPTPIANTRLRPNWSASAPAAIRQLPNASMNALVIQFIATGPPCRSRPIAGVATAPPENDSGNATAAMHTAASTHARRCAAPVEPAENG